jgi:hypothetical protein
MLTETVMATKVTVAPGGVGVVWSGVFDFGGTHRLGNEIFNDNHCQNIFWNRDSRFRRRVMMCGFIKAVELR